MGSLPSCLRCSIRFHSDIISFIQDNDDVLECGFDDRDGLVYEESVRKVPLGSETSSKVKKT